MVVTPPGAIGPVGYVYAVLLTGVWLSGSWLLTMMFAVRAGEVTPARFLILKDALAVVGAHCMVTKIREPLGQTLYDDGSTTRVDADA